MCDYSIFAFYTRTGLHSHRMSLDPPALSILTSTTRNAPTTVRLIPHLPSSPTSPHPTLIPTILQLLNTNFQHYHLNNGNDTQEPHRQHLSSIDHDPSISSESRDPEHV
ncbi:hypothetical protein L208DRAFT_1419410 [Tricholoma matsutake]|nr:hypothetical protein L208DRAFT_1419410 [Tricholoma matsutake 945]